MKRSILLLTLSFFATATSHAQDAVRDLDVAKFSFSYASGMDFDTGPGELSLTRFQAGGFVSEPIKLGGDWKALPLIRYRGLNLEVDGTTAAFPLQDESLHQLSASAILFHATDQSPWLYGAWFDVSLASDFQHLDGDDFLYSIAAGVGYRISPQLTVALAAAALDLNGDEQFLPGIALFWRPSDPLLVAIYGPNLMATYRFNADWALSFTAEPGGGAWNISGPAGRSESLTLRSYRVGLRAEHRLNQSLWLDFGVGMTLGNKVEIGSTSGLTRFTDHPDDGWFAYTGLRVLAW